MSPLLGETEWAILPLGELERFFKMMKYIYMIMCAAAMVACGHNEHDEHDHGDAGHEGHNHEDGVIEFGEVQRKAAGLEVVTLQLSDFQEAIRVSGQVTEAQGDEAAVVAKSSGVLTFTRDHLTEGATISKGEVFARVSAAGLAGSDAVAQNAVELERAKSAYERAQRLVGEGIVSREEYERAKAEYEQARILSSVRFNQDVNKIASSVSSPIAGYVKRVLVKQGEYVEVGQLVATVTKSCDLQLRAEVPEKYFARMHDIVGANFAMSYDMENVRSIEQLNGHLVSMGRTATEGSAYIPVTFEFENHGDIVPGSFADIWLLSNVRTGVLSVPVTALTEEQGLYFVYVQGHDEDEYEKREVQLGASNGSHTEIVSGLKVGEKVVVKGVYQLKIAAASGAIPEAHSHSH